MANVKENLVPSGVIHPYVGQTAPPGYLICNGAAVPVAAYPDLYAAIGTTYGGDGVLAFTLPDLRGKFIRGASATNILGTALSDTTARPTNAFSFTSTGSTHNHQVLIYNDDISGTGSNSTQILDDADGSYDGTYAVTTDTSTTLNNGVYTDGRHTHTVSTTSGGDSETRPINIYVNYIIKV